jgi:hypothetical protein
VSWSTFTNQNIKLNLNTGEINILSVEIFMLSWQFVANLILCLGDDTTLCWAGLSVFHLKDKVSKQWPSTNIILCNEAVQNFTAYFQLSCGPEQQISEPCCCIFTSLEDGKSHMWDVSKPKPTTTKCHHLKMETRLILWDFRFSRWQVWSLESSGM